MAQKGIVVQTRILQNDSNTIDYYHEISAHGNNVELCLSNITPGTLFTTVKAAIIAQAKAYMETEWGITFGLLDYIDFYFYNSGL